MAEIKSVHFSPILEHVCDDTLLVRSDMGLFTEEVNVEEAYTASLSKRAKKYRFSNEGKGEPRGLQTRKIVLLAIGFIFLLGVGGVVIYLITQKLYKRDGYIYSGNVGEKKTGLPSSNTTLQENSSRLVALSTTKSPLEISKEYNTVYSAKATTYPPTITVYGSSGLATGATSTSNFSTQLPRKVVSPSLVRQDSNTLLKTSGIKGHWHVTHSFTLHKTSSKKKNTTYPESVWSSASLQSITASTLSFDESRGKMSYYSEENASYMYVTSTSPLAQLSTKSLKNVETVIRRYPNSSSKHTWLSSGTEFREFPNTRNFTSARENAKFKQTTKQRGQSRFGLTSFTSVTSSKPLFLSRNISEKSSEIQTTGAVIKTKVMAISNLSTTRSTNIMIILSDRHSVSTVIIKTLTENENGSNFNRNLMTSSSDQIESSNMILSLSRSQRTTWMQQISSSSSYHLGAGSIQVSLLPKVSSTISALHVSVSLTSLDKHTETRQSVIPNPLFTVLKLSATKFVSPTEKSSRTRSQLDSSSAVVTMTSSPLLFSILKRSSSTADEIQTPISIMTNSASVHPTSHTTASNTGTVTQPRHSSTGGFLEHKSMVSLKFHKLSISVRETSLSGALNTISKPGFQTNAIVLKPTPTESIHSSPVEIVTLPILSVSQQHHSSFGNSETVTSKESNIYTHFPQSRSTLDSKSTVQAMASLSIAEPVPTLQLGSSEFPVVTSSVPQLKSVESIKGSLSRHQTPSVATAKLQTQFPYTLQNGSINTRAHSTATSIVIVTGIQSSAWYFLTTTIMASRKVTSQVLTAGIPVITPSIQHLRPTESIQGSLLSNKTSSVSTFQYLYTLSSRQTLTNPTITRTQIQQLHAATATPAVKYTALSTGLLPSAINNSIGPSTDISVNSSGLTTHLPHLKVNSTTSGVLAPNSAFTSQANLTHSGGTAFYHISSLQVTNTPVVNPTSNSSFPFKLMDGSLIIRNKNYHINLSNPNTTMFITFADEVETIIMNIFSLNNTDVLSAEVTSFRNGSVVADFYLRVTYHSAFSDQQFAQLLSEANKTLWHGYHVTNITVTLRTIKEDLSEPSHDQDDTGLSKAAIIAILTIFTALLFAVGGFGVYFCKKKGMCQISKVKPVGSPIPPSELETIQPVRRGTWVMNDQPLLEVDVPTHDPNYRSDSSHETLSMRSLKRSDTDPDPEEKVDPHLLQEAMKSPFEPDYENADVVDDSTNYGPHPSTSRSISNSNLIDSDDRPTSGLPHNTYLSMKSISEEDRKC